MSMYVPFKHIPDFQYNEGWDKYAIKYAALLKPDTLYYLHKQVMYDYLNKKILPQFAGKKIKVLDVNCGTGNDFPYWLENSELLVGIDGSPGMLNKAHEIYDSAITAGKLKLHQGMLQDINAGSLGEKKFDIIYSITGGFSYITDEELAHSFKVLKTMLSPGGIIITAHLNTFCLPETIAYLLQGKWSRAKLRLNRNIVFKDGNILRLRNKPRLKKLLSPYFESLQFLPLICIAPPYQTDISFSRGTLRFLKKAENRMVDMNVGIPWADQIVVVCK